jgi:protein-S-isoprenylcysteine O-methyltransferase Ste14
MAFITPDLLRVTLLIGLIGHKALWELLKRPAPGTTPPASGRVRRTTVVKVAKMGLLGFLLVQTACLEVLPLAENPAPLRVAGAAIFLVGLALAMVARLQLGRNWADIEDYQVLPGQALIATGLYRYVRHPIYGGDLLLLFGLQLALNSWLVLGVIPAGLLVSRQAAAEEALLARALPGYAEYCARTKRFVPLVL